MSHTEAEWLGLCCRTESDRPHEWPYVAWVVRNRVEEVGRFRTTYVGVIRQPMQFSAFNASSELTDDEAFDAVVESLRARGMRVDGLDLPTHCAAWILGIPSRYSPLPRRTFYFWSPQSMKPEGRIPSWARRLERYTPLDPWRFTFGREL